MASHVDNANDMASHVDNTGDIDDDVDDRAAASTSSWHATCSTPDMNASLPRLLVLSFVFTAACAPPNRATLLGEPLVFDVASASLGADGTLTYAATVSGSDATLLIQNLTADSGCVEDNNEVSMLISDNNEGVWGASSACIALDSFPTAPGQRLVGTYEATLFNLGTTGDDDDDGALTDGFFDVAVN